MVDIQLKRGNRNLLPNSLKDGEVYLIKDEDKLAIKNGDKVFELPNQNEVNTKVTATAIGAKGQVLVKKDNESNDGEWIEYFTGNKVTLSNEVPENPIIGDMWFQPIT